MSDREPESGVAVWIALRRAHQGGIANLQGHWLDSGSRVPGYVADALDELTSAGLLTLGEKDPESCGARRITITDAGCVHYVSLCQVHNPNGRAAVSTPQRWAHSPHDQRNHLLTVGGTDQIGVLIGVCGHRMLWSVPTSAQPTGRPCPTCQALPGVPVPAPQFRQPPDSGRPAVEQSPRPITAPGGAPGGQPDPTPRTGESSVGLLRWAHCSGDGRLHLLQPADVAAATGGHAQALCGRRLPPEGLTITITSSAGALCLTCIADITPGEESPRPDTHRPVDPRPTAGQDVPTARRPIGHQPAPKRRPTPGGC